MRAGERDPRLETAHLVTVPGSRPVQIAEPKRCPACRAKTWIMLHHWQGGDPKRVRRTVMCSRIQDSIERCDGA